VISHVTVGISDLERALAFYKPVLAELGLHLKFVELENQWAGWMSPGAPRPLFLITKPFNGLPHAAGNGQMVALMADTRAMVDRVYAVALAHSAVCEGPPGPRPHYTPDYYGAYFRDLDGNKLCVVCHAPQFMPSSESTPSA
jgi:lactoylglutathione lyase